MECPLPRHAELMFQLFYGQDPLVPAFVIIPFSSAPAIHADIFSGSKKTGMLIVEYKHPRFFEFGTKILVMFHPDLMISHRIVHRAETDDFLAQGNTCRRSPAVFYGHVACDTDHIRVQAVDLSDQALIVPAKYRSMKIR